MITHARLSPSKRHRWALCPGSVREEANFPDSRGLAAIDGTHSHTLLEYCIQFRRFIDPLTQVGATFEDDDGKFTVDQDRAERVKIAVDYIQDRSMGGVLEVIPEERVNPQHLTGRDDLSGTVDCQIVGPDWIELIDYKDGMGVVSANCNPQLEQYAIGKLSECNLDRNIPDQYPWREVHMTIIQPKLALKGLSPITTWTVPVSHLLDERLTVLSAQASATDDPNAPLVPGESQCKFCRSAGSCSALADNAMKKIGVVFRPVVTQVTDVAQQSADKDPTTMDNQQICQIMEAAPLVRQLLDAVEKEAHRRLTTGVVIPGLKLVNGRGSRAWALPDEEMAEKLGKMGIPKNAIWETKLVTPAKTEKLVWEKRDGTRISLTDRQLKRMEQEYIIKLAGKPTVVFESDSRPAVIMNAAPMFSAVPTLCQENGIGQTFELSAEAGQISLPSWLS